MVAKESELSVSMARQFAAPWHGALPPAATSAPPAAPRRDGHFARSLRDDCGAMHGMLTLVEHKGQPSKAAFGCVVKEGNFLRTSFQRMSLVADQ